MVRIFLLALVIGSAAASALAQTKPKLPIEHKVEFAEIKGGRSAQPLARCAVVRYRISGEAEKATSFCAFLGRNGVPTHRNDLERPDNIVSLGLPGDASKSFDARFKSDFPKRDPKTDFAPLIAAEAAGSRIRQFVLEGVRNGAADTDVQIINAPPGLEKDTLPQQYLKLKSLLEPPAAATPVSGAMSIPLGEYAAVCFPNECWWQSMPMLLQQGAINWQKIDEQRWRDAVAAKDTEIAALTAKLESLSPFEAWAGSGHAGGDDAVALLSNYFWAFQPGMKLLGPSAGLIALPAIGILALLASGIAIGAMLARRPRSDPQQPQQAEWAEPAMAVQDAVAPAPAQDAASTPPLFLQIIYDALDSYARTTASFRLPQSARIQAVEEMLRPLAQIDRRFDGPATLLSDTATDLAKLEHALNVPLGDIAARIMGQQQEIQEYRDLLAEETPVRLREELRRDWDADTLRPVLDVARKCRDDAWIYRQVLSDLGSGGRRIVGQIDGGNPPDALPLRLRLAAFENIRRTLAIPQDRLTDSLQVVSLLWTALQRLFPDLDTSRPDTLCPAILDSVEQFAAAVSLPNEEGAPTLRSLPDIAAALKMRQAEADRRCREGDEALRRLGRWRQFLADRLGMPMIEDDRAQAAALVAEVQDGRAKAQQFTRLTSELEAQRAHSDSRWQLATMLLRRAGHRIPDPDDLGALEISIGLVEKDDADLFLIRVGIASVMPPLDLAVGGLMAAGRNDVVALLGLDQFAAELARFADMLENLDPSAAQGPADYWNCLIAPSIVFLHRVMRAELVLQTYFADDPVFEAVRRRVSDAAWLMRSAARHAGARCHTAPLLQPAPTASSLRYNTTPEFRAVPEIHRRVLQREAQGGEFAIDLQTAGFAAPFSNTALTLVLFNPADWV